MAQAFTAGTISDRGEIERAQDRSDHAGTTLRLLDDGRFPEGNPFVGRPGVLPEIFTYGNRNPQGMAMHPQTGEIWLNEHGARVVTRSTSCVSSAPMLRLEPAI